MNVSLTNELEIFINELVASGNYFSASEVVRDGLRLLKEREELRVQKLAALRRDILIGYEEGKRGEAGPLDFEELKARGRRRLAEINEA